LSAVNQTCRIGLVGLGRMGLRHVEALKMLGLAPAAVCDLDPGKSSPFEGTALSYTSWQDLLNRETLDLLIVATLADTHASITCAAARGGVPRILCEKPMATGLLEAWDMVKACRDAGARLAVNHGRRYHPGYVHLKEAVGNGIIGPLRQINVRMGGGRLGGNGCHFLDLARFLTGAEAESAVGWVSPQGHPNPRGAQYNDPGGFGVVMFTNGCRLVIDLSEDLGVPGIVEMVGSYGTVCIDEATNQWSVAARSEQDKGQPLFRYDTAVRQVSFDPGRAFDVIQETGSAIAELLGAQPVSSSGDEAFKALELYAALRLSSIRGHLPVALPLTLDATNTAFRWAIA